MNKRLEIVCRDNNLISDFGFYNGRQFGFYNGRQFGFYNGRQFGFYNGRSTVDASIVITLLLFADDMAILAKTPEDLQTSLDLLHTYCSNLGLEVNTTSKPRVRYWEIT